MIAGGKHLVARCEVVREGLLEFVAYETLGPCAFASPGVYG